MFKVILVGGYDDEYTSLEDIEVVDIANKTLKSEISSLPHPRYRAFGHYFQKQQIGIVCGGQHRTGYKQWTLENLDTCYTLSKNGKWEERPKLISPRVDATSIAIKSNDGTSKLWVLGGYPRSASNTTEILSDPYGTFQMSHLLPEIIAKTCLTAINESAIFLAGNAFGGRRTAYLIDVSKEPFKFTKLPAMREQRLGPACAVINETTVLVAGGLSDKKSSELFSLVDWKWSEGPTLDIGYYRGGYFSIDRNYPLILIGGFSNTLLDRNIPTPFIRTYNPWTNMFETLPNYELKKQRSYFALINIGNN